MSHWAISAAPKELVAISAMTSLDLQSHISSHSLDISVKCGAIWFQLCDPGCLVGIATPSSNFPWQGLAENWPWPPHLIWKSFPTLSSFICLPWRGGSWPPSFLSSSVLMCVHVSSLYLGVFLFFLPFKWECLESRDWQTVVTAEALMTDVSDQSLDQSSQEGHHFRLDDVDWNSAAQRYPNLFEDIHSKKRAASAYVLDSPEYLPPKLEKSRRQRKSVDWGLLPSSSLSSMATTSDRGSAAHTSVPSSIGTDFSPSLTSPTQEQEVSSSSGDLPALELRRPKTPVGSSSSSLGTAVVGIGPARQGSLSSALQDQGRRKVLYSSLKIVKIHKQGKFIRVLNESLEESVDISGFVLKQLIHYFPVCIYRFPKDTLLAPRHHITVWGEGVSLVRKRVPQILQRELIHFYTNPGCVTLLLNPKGQVMSEYQAQHCVSEASRSFADHTDISIDCYPLLENEGEKPQEAPGLGSKSRGQQFRAPKKTKVPGPPPGLEGQPGPRRSRLLKPIPSINISKNFSQWQVKEAVAGRESLHGATVPLPTIPELAQLPGIGKKMQEKCIPRANQFLPPWICRKHVDVDCPMVALSVQKTTESRFGQKQLSYPPITRELREPL
ncbi:lamin tail domain-containing protein 2 isoform X2 [Phascolarctos cinereus]